MRGLLSIFALVFAGSSFAADWPGWRGSDRTGVSEEKGMLKKWPKGGPKQAFNVEGVGSGYSTPAVADGKIYVMGGKSQQEYVICLDANDGSQVWEKPIGRIAGVGYPGPRCTPTVDGEFIFAESSSGDVACLKRADGAVVWQKSFKSDFGGAHGAWGFAESPLVDGDRLIVTPGGGSATMVALNKADGETIWKCSVESGNTAAYSSPIVTTVGKAKQYVNFVGGALIGVDAETGSLAWSYRKSSNGTANCPTAVAKDGFVFSASGYGTGGGLVKIGPKSAKEEYFQPKFVNHHGGFVLIGKHLYGTNERELLCMEFRTGKIAWSNRSVGKGSIVAAGNLLVVRSEQGPVALVSATPQKYTELGRFEQPDRSNDPSWPYPVVANGLLYLRDQNRLMAYVVGNAK